MCMVHTDGVAVNTPLGRSLEVKWSRSVEKETFRIGLIYTYFYDRNFYICYTIELTALEDILGI